MTRLPAQRHDLRRKSLVPGPEYTTEKQLSSSLHSASDNKNKISKQRGRAPTCTYRPTTSHLHDHGPLPLFRAGSRQEARIALQHNHSLIQHRGPDTIGRTQGVSAHDE